MNDPAPHANGDCLGSISSAQFFHDVLDVNLNSFFCNKELLCNISIPAAAGYCRRTSISRSVRGVTVMFSQVGCDFCWNALLTRMRLTNDFHEFSWWHAFQDISTSSSMKGSLNLHVAGKSGQNESMRSSR